MQLSDDLETWPGGEIMLRGHRIGLYTIVRDHRAGKSPEAMAEQYPALSLAVIHRVIAFYLDNSAEVDDYMQRIDANIDRFETRAPAGPTLAELRRRLAAREVSA